MAASSSADEPGAQRGGQPALTLDPAGTTPTRLRASSSVSVSTYQEPPAGSATRAMLDSSASRAWVLRAIRRENVVGRPIARRTAATVTASAPPVAAPKQASVVRSMFTHGSRRVIIGPDVTACCAWPRPAAGTPRQLGDAGPQPPGGPQLGDRQELVRRCGETELELPAGDLGRRSPALRQRPQVGDAGGERAAELLGVRAAGLVVGRRVDGHRPHPRVLGQAPGRRAARRRTRSALAPVRACDGRAGRGPGCRRAAGSASRSRHSGHQPAAAASAVSGAGVQHHGREVEQHVGEHLGQVAGRDAGVADAQPERGDAVLEVGQHRLPGDRRVGVGEVLADVPALPAPPGGRLPRT